MNFRRFFSKRSSTSSSSSKNNSITSDIPKLKKEIDYLKQTIDCLKVAVDSRDAAIGILAREKEKLYVELKGSQRTINNLRQQLVNERSMHSNENKFVTASKYHPIQEDTSQSINMSGESSQRLLGAEMKSKDKIIYDMGAKYMKIKSSKARLQQKLEEMEDENKRIYEDIVSLLLDNKRKLNHFLENMEQYASSTTDSKKYMKLLQINVNLNFENTQLKMLLSSQKYSVHKNPQDTCILKRKLATLFKRNKITEKLVKTTDGIATTTSLNNIKALKSYSDSCIPCSVHKYKDPYF